VRARRVSSRQLVERSLERISRLDGPLNAVVALRAELALSEARALDERVAAGEDPGPLAGLPVLVKDLEDVIGLRTTLGSDQVGPLPAEVFNTSVQNTTGHPALSLPAGRLPNGLPFGLQVTGPRFRDHLLLDLASSWEQARPWPRSADGYEPFDAGLAR
jgi:Asp-tRNA(Asn)/Glu-tRNA(Gln) amidotransferase A subunit family amidase